MQIKIKCCSMKSNNYHQYLPYASHEAKHISYSLLPQSYNADPRLIPISQMRGWGLETPITYSESCNYTVGRQKRQLRLGNAHQTSRSRKSPGWVFYISSYLLLKTTGCFSGRLMSSASGQKLFCETCSAFRCSFDEFIGEKVVSPSYSSTILAPPAPRLSLEEWVEGRKDEREEGREK